MILSDVRQAVRVNLDDLQYSGSTIDQAINWFQNELFNNTRTSTLETSQSIVSAVNATTLPFPIDMQLLTNLTVTSPSIRSIWKLKLEQQDFELQFPGFDTYTARAVYNWCTYGRAIRFSAPLLTATTFRVEYVRKPLKVTVDSDILDLPDQYFELAVLGAQVRIMELNEDYAEASQVRSELDTLRTTFIRNEARGGAVAGPRIVRSNRRRVASTSSNGLWG